MCKFYLKITLTLLVGLVALLVIFAVLPVSLWMLYSYGYYYIASGLVFMLIVTFFIICMKKCTPSKLNSNVEVDVVHRNDLIRSPVYYLFPGNLYHNND